MRVESVKREENIVFLCNLIIIERNFKKELIKEIVEIYGQQKRGLISL